MLSAILTYLAIDAILSVITLAVAVYVLRKRGGLIRQVLRNWLGVKDPVYYAPEVSPSDFDEEGLYMGNRHLDLQDEDMDMDGEGSFDDLDDDMEATDDEDTGYINNKNPKQ